MGFICYSSQTWGGEKKACAWNWVPDSANDGSGGYLVMGTLGKVESLII